MLRQISRRNLHSRLYGLLRLPGQSYIHLRLLSSSNANAAAVTRIIQHTSSPVPLITTPHNQSQAPPVRRDILAGLSEEQVEVVKAPLMNQLIFAGAGTGKTRVLTRRVAWAIQSLKLDPSAIMAVTFSVKAAKELKHRVQFEMGRIIANPWMGITFHSAALQVLKRFAPEMQNSFLSYKIISEAAQYRIVSDIMKGLNIPPRPDLLKEHVDYILKHKEGGRRPQHLIEDKENPESPFLQVYQRYQEVIKKDRLLDFGEIMLWSFELLKTAPEVANRLREHFKLILVDEFQDTNLLQYEWLRAIAGELVPVFAVGDHNQAIYEWRDAKPDSADVFVKDFAPVLTASLKQNFRSAKPVLDAANNLISYNSSSCMRRLWGERGAGTPVIQLSGRSDFDEAEKISGQIIEWRKQGRRFEDIAVLTRSRSQSSVIEAALIRRKIPYTLLGRTRLSDSISGIIALYIFDAVMTSPVKGIDSLAIPNPGLPLQSTLNALTALSKISSSGPTNFVEGAKIALTADEKLSLLPRRVQFIIKQVDELGSLVLEVPTSLCISKGVLDKSEGDLEGPDMTESYSKAASNFVALAQLHQANFSKLSLDDDFKPRDLSDEDVVTLSTVHKAKGLEFSCVIVAGLEEEIFPCAKALERGGRSLEEERRLAYVAITRAKDELVLTKAESRRRFRENKSCLPARFLTEIMSERSAAPETSTEASELLK